MRKMGHCLLKQFDSYKVIIMPLNVFNQTSMQAHPSKEVADF